MVPEFKFCWLFVLLKVLNHSSVASVFAPCFCYMGMVFLIKYFHLQRRTSCVMDGFSQRCEGV